MPAAVQHLRAGLVDHLAVGHVRAGSPRAGAVSRIAIQLERNARARCQVLQPGQEDGVAPLRQHDIRIVALEQPVEAVDGVSRIVAIENHRLPVHPGC